MNTAPRTAPDLRDVLYQFAIEHPSPNAACLDDFIRHNPRHAADLTDFAIELAVDALMQPNDADLDRGAHEQDASPDVDLAMSRFHNRLYEVRKGGPSGALDAAPLNPFAALDRTRTRALAERLHGNSVFVMKLRDRQVALENMSAGFRSEIADELDVPMDVLVAHFAAQQQVQSHVRFKSVEKPQAPAKQSFEEAVRTCGLSPEQESYLLSL